MSSLSPTARVPAALDVDGDCEVDANTCGRMEKASADTSVTQLEGDCSLYCGVKLIIGRENSWNGG